MGILVDFSWICIGFSGDLGGVTKDGFLGGI